MTDHDDTSDDLASAHLDGLTTADEARRIDADPELQARVAAMRAARDAIRAEVPPPSPERREQAIAAALRAHDDAPADGAAVTTIASARASRRRVQPRRLVGIAAAVLLLAIAVPVVAELAEGDSDQAEMATSAGDSAQPDEAGGRSDTDDASASAGAEAFEESADELSAPTPGAAGGSSSDQAAALVEVGSFSSIEELRRAVRSAVDHQADAPPDASTRSATERDLAAVGCIDRIDDRADADGATMALRGTATLAGEAVVVAVVAAVDGTRTLHVVDPAMDCEAVATTALDP